MKLRIAIALTTLAFGATADHADRAAAAENVFRPAVLTDEMPPAALPAVLTPDAAATVEVTPIRWYRPYVGYRAYYRPYYAYRPYYGYYGYRPYYGYPGGYYRSGYRGVAPYYW